MIIKLLSLFLVLFAATASFAQNGTYKGPDKPIIPADNKEIRVKLDQCIEDINEVSSDNETHDAAKDLCKLREHHQTSRQLALKGLTDLVQHFKGATNHDHDQNLAQTVALIQNGVKNCLDALASQEYCHNLTCATDPENDAIFCDNQAHDLINKILGH